MASVKYLHIYTTVQIFDESCLNGQKDLSVNTGFRVKTLTQLWYEREGFCGQMRSRIFRAKFRSSTCSANSYSADSSYTSYSEVMAISCCGAVISQKNIRAQYWRIPQEMLFKSDCSSKLTENSMISIPLRIGDTARMSWLTNQSRVF